MNFEEENEVKDYGVAPPSTTEKGANSNKKISAIRDWTQEDMLAAIDDVEFNGCSIRALAKKHGIEPTSMHYWIDGFTHLKWKGPLTMLTKQEEEEVVFWCKDMAQLAHGLEIQLKYIISMIYQGRTNPFIDGFLGKAWWAGFKLRHLDLVL